MNCMDRIISINGPSLVFRVLVGGLLSTTLINTANAIDYDTMSSIYNTRVEEMMNTTGWNFGQALDTKQIFREWRQNQARAQLKFSEPGVYHGKISQITVDNGNANLIIDSGTNTAATVILANYQAWPWKLVNHKWEIVGLQSNLEFASNFDVGQELYFQCRKVEFVWGVYLNNCLAFPPEVAKDG